jgi:hypothetical protein
VFAALSLLLLTQKATGPARTFPDGTKIALVAVTKLAAKKSWSPAGTVLRDFVAPPLLKRFSVAPVKSKGSGRAKPAYVFVFHVDPPNRGELPSLGFKVGKSMLLDTFVLPDEKRGGWWAGAEIPAGTRGDVAVGVGTGKWSSTSTHDLQTGITKGPKFFAGILRDVVIEKGRSISAVDSSLPPALASGFATRIKLYELGGGSPQLVGIGPIRKGSNPRWQYVESGNRIIKAELQTRPYRWATYPDVRVPKS